MQRTGVSQEVRQRVLDRIRAAIEAGDEQQAIRIARELQRRWRKAGSCRSVEGLRSA